MNGTITDIEVSLDTLSEVIRDMWNGGPPPRINVCRCNGHLCN